MKALTVGTAIQGFGAETRLMVMRFQAAYKEMKNDAVIVGHTPPVLGLARALGEPDGIDPVDGSSSAVWRDRLSIIFASMMEVKPYYVEMRYVGLADRGKELVSVVRYGDVLLPIDEAHRARLGDVAYFQEALSLSEDDFYISEVIYRDDTDGDVSYRSPVQHIVWPVYVKGSLYGQIIITVDYEKMLHRVLEEGLPNKESYIVNQDGDMLYVDPENHIAPLVYHASAKALPHPQDQDLLKSDLTEHTFTRDGKVAYFVKVPVSKHNPDLFIGVLLRVPEDMLLAKAYEIQKHMLLLSGLIVLVGLAVAAFASRRLTAPITGMVESIVAATKAKDIDLPTDRPDEIGDLARAFNEMMGKLEAEENKSSLVFMNAFDGLFTVDEAGIVQQMNPACARLFGDIESTFIGNPVSHLLIPSDGSQIVQYIAAFASEKDRPPYALEKEMTGLRSNGKTFPLEVSFIGKETSNKEAAGDVLFIGVVKDISSRKKSDQLKDSFAATVSNELRTPLTAILDSLLLLKTHLGSKIDAKGQRLLDIAHDGATRLTNFLNDVIDIEKISSNKMGYVLEEVNICPLVHYIVEGQQVFAEQYKVALVLETNCTKAVCKIDGSRFVQALVNLISNAMKFSPDGGTVHVTLSKDPQAIRVSVSDQGNGIPADFQGRIFEKFAQAEQMPAKAQGGSGLGLNIAKTIIAAFNGKLTFETQQAKGTTFHITLPLQPAAAPQPYATP